MPPAIGPAPETQPLPGNAAGPAPAPPRRSAAGRVLRFVGRQLRWSWPFLVLILLFAVYTGWQRRSTGGAAGVGVTGPVGAAAAGKLRVGIYNIQGSVGKDADDAALERIARTIADTDLAGLVEVRANARKSDDRNQAQRIADAINRGWIFAPAERRFWADGGGNAIVSRVPVGDWTRLPLPASDDAGSHRNALLADVPLGAPNADPKAGGQTVRVIVTHIDRGDSRASQMKAVAHLFASVQSPAVLLADLNARPNEPLLQELLSTASATDAIDASPIKAGPERVDYIIVKGLRVTDAGRVDDPAASDHAYFWADLELIP